MADLQPTKARLALLADIAAGNVVDDADGTPLLDVDGEPVRVAATTWEMERAGWVMQPEGSARWEPTEGGLDVLEGRADG